MPPSRRPSCRYGRARSASSGLLSRLAPGASQASSSERRAVPSRQPLLEQRFRGVRAGLRAERDRMGGPLLLRAFACEDEARAAGLLADFLGELEERVADAPDRYRWDYVKAHVICRKDG